MDFVAIDVETANPDLSSICQIGVAKYRAGQLVDERCTYIDPLSHFDPRFIAIHGIDESSVSGAPSFDQIANDLWKELGGQVVVSHMHFDRVALHQASKKVGINVSSCTWLDSALVARRCWQECSKRGYGLRDVCRLIGYEFDHHNALEDAKAAARIVLTAGSEQGLGIDDLFQKVMARPAHSSGGGKWSSKIQIAGNPDGPLFGEVLVFTGALSIPRQEAAQIAASAGCEVATNVTKKTTLLVVGDQDIAQLAGHEKSSKHRKAEQLIESGQPIRILRQTDFEAIVDLVL